MRAHLVDFADQPTPEETIDKIKVHLARRPTVKVDVEQLLGDRDAGRL